MSLPTNLRSPHGWQSCSDTHQLAQPGLHTEMRTPEYFRTEFIDHFAEISCFNQEVLLGNARKAVQGRL